MHQNYLTFRGIVIWLICAFFFMYEFLLRTVLGTFQHPIMTDLHLSAIKFAVLSSTAYQLIYGCMQLPVGLIADHYGLKRTLLFAVSLCAIANLGFAVSEQYEVILFFRVLMGLGSSFGFVCLLLAVYDWLPRKNLAFFIGLSQFIGTIGPMFAAGPINALAQTQELSWRGLFITLAFIAALMTLPILYFVDSNLANNPNSSLRAQLVSLWKNLCQLMQQKQVWWIGLFSSSVYFSIEYLSENEGISFLIIKGFSSIQAGYLITMTWIGYAIGCLVLGYISDQLKLRKPIMLFSASLVLVALGSIIYLPLADFSMLICFFLLGIGTSGQSLGFALISEYCTHKNMTTGFAFNNTMIMFFPVINAPILGALLSHPLNRPHSLGEYQQAFAIMLSFVLISLILSAWLIKEPSKKALEQYQPT